MSTPAPPTASCYALGNRWGIVTPGLVRCTDCDGSGASEPGCELCQGERHVAVADAEAAGYDRADGLVSEAYGDALSTMTCPECGGCLCGRCDGSGEIEADALAQESDRVLVCALAGGRRIPTVFYRGRGGQMQRDDETLLCYAAGGTLHQGGLIRLISTPFTDHVTLTPSGQAAAKAAWRRHRQRQRAWIAQERAARRAA